MGSGARGTTDDHARVAAALVPFVVALYASSCALLGDSVPCTRSAHCAPHGVCEDGRCVARDDAGSDDYDDEADDAGVDDVGSDDAGHDDAGRAVDACVATRADSTLLCTDFDGDGFFGATGGCAQATDCDDRDPLVRPGAFEIPGDGVDDGCAGGQDAPIDETTGVFVAPDGSDATGVGSRAAPFATIAVAHAVADAADVALFLAVGAYDLDGPFTFQVPLIGGLMRAADGAWRSAGAASTLTAGGPGVVFTTRAFVQDVVFVPTTTLAEQYFIGVDVADDSRRVVVAPSCAGACGTFGVRLVDGVHHRIDTSAPGANMLNDVETVLVVDSVFGAVVHQSPLRMLRCRVGVMVSDDQLVAVSSLIEADPLEYALSGNGPIELYGTTVRGLGPDDEAVRFYGDFVAVNARLAADEAVFFVGSAVRYAMLGTAIETTSGFSAQSADACEAGECAQGAGNVAATLGGVGLPYFDLPAGPVGGPAIDVPTAVVGDLDGACRGGASAPLPGAHAAP